MKWNLATKIAASGLVILFGLVGSIWGLPKVFTTVERYTIEEGVQTKLLEQKIESNKAEIAGVSLQQQYYFSEQEIARLKREIRDIVKQYGSDPSRMPNNIAAIYLELIKDLEREIARAEGLKSRLK